MKQAKAAPNELGQGGGETVLSGAASSEMWLTPGRFSALLTLLILATFPGVLLGRETFVFRDFGPFSYPVAYFHRECFWRGELPLWNPYSDWASVLTKLNYDPA